MKALVLIFCALAVVSCANKKQRPDRETARKFPHCYHQNMKIFNECVKRNEAGERVTALEIENDGMPK